MDIFTDLLFIDILEKKIQNMVLKLFSKFNGNLNNLTFKTVRIFCLPRVLHRSNLIDSLKLRLTGMRWMLLKNIHTCKEHNIKATT